MQRDFPIADDEASAIAQGAGGGLDGDGAGPLDRSREDFGNHPQSRPESPTFVSKANREGVEYRIGGSRT